ncbi:hypothetical protein L914_16453 [Phytophthora nicotianae]|uniref:Uncharacterized protein n=1 Tax=Phytophthora nicotianae TaxID=4792 RepID=W2MKW3_PHYNI|nr:hypothetical protein L914_16453 [Phytophthora nicotianae]
MSLSGRQQILLSIYGAINDGKKKALKKPQRPSTSSALVRRPSSARRPAPFVRTDSKERQHGDEENKTKQPNGDQIEIAPTPSSFEARMSFAEDEKVTAIPKPASQRFVQCNGEGKQKMEAITGGRSENVASVSKGTNAAAVIKDGAVISLYGDGFLEIPLSKGPEGKESSRLLGSSGFSITMSLFKAADTEKHKARVEKDGARHTTPELDDTGDFVRWLCCGSTDRSVFGCFANQDEGSEGIRKPGCLLNDFQGPGKSTPRLLCTKLHGENSDDEATFSIYDRGVHVNYREKGEDGGCRVRWRGWECLANNYEVPSNRWVNIKVVFDCRYLQIFFDDELVDCARIQPVETPSTLSNGFSRGRRAGDISAWVQTPSSSNSVYVGGYPSHARSVRDWRARIGFVGLISSFKLWKLSSDQQRRKFNEIPKELLISLTIPDVGNVRDNSTFDNVVNVHRNVFWRLNSPPMWTPISEKAATCSVSTAKESVVLLANFFDGGHYDVGVASANSFVNLILTVVQSGDIRVVIDYAAEYSVQRSHDHVCRSHVEYEQKTSALIASIEQMSPLLTVVVNSRSPIGSFEISMELTRAAGRSPVVVMLHSMNISGCFPKLEDIKKKIESIVLFEAKRSPGEEIQIQAFRHLLAVAGQSRHNRERIFMESVINRKLVLTERKVAAEFEKIGFFFASTELQEVVSYLKRIQDNYSRTHNHRMDDLPSLSMLTPTPTGLYTLPFMNTLLVSSTMMCDNGGPRSPWRFVCVLVDHDFQLVDFVHEGCPVTKRGGISYRQGQSTYNGIVDRLYLRLTALSNRVFCVLFSLQKITEDESTNISGPNFTRNMSKVRIQIENVEEHQVLGMFDTKPHAKCRWFTLAAVYRSKKNNQWKLQAIGGCGSATSIYAGVDELNVLLAELRIIQTYEIRVYYIETGAENEHSTTENHESRDFVRRLAKNIRFGRNGRIVLVPVLESSDKLSNIRFRIALKLQEMEHEIDVYTHHNAANRSLPTIQSVYRTILRILSQHGIKECLQQNPFAPQNKKVRRHVEFRIVSAQTNDPVEKVHVFIEKNVSFDALGSNLAKTVLPTLMMGSRLMSIRRRLQKKRVTEITREVAETFVSDCIAKALKRTTIATSLNVKLVSVVRARALLRNVMRQRYEKIKNGIIERARKSEQAREFSQSFPTRLQKLFANSLELSNSERDLLRNSTREELAELDLMLRGIPIPLKEKMPMDENYLLEEWTKAQFATESLEDNSKNEASLSENQTSSEDSSKPEETSDGVVKDRRQVLVTDSEGRASCRLVPGSYSLYVFHLDYFEWTSLVAVYPTISASGLSSGPTTATSSVQEIVIPLDVYRWTYSLQLVDYFHPHANVKLAGIPLQITNNCSSERQIVMTDSNGCATWDVSKGLYAVDVLRECSCVLYSALKQVVVDGGRYRTSRTIPMPVLFGGVKVTVLVVSIKNTHSDLANIKFHAASFIGNIANVTVDKRRNARIPIKTDLAMKEEPSEGDVSVGSSRVFKLRLGTYRLKVTSNDYFPVSLPVKVTWASSKTQTKDGNRYLGVLSPLITTERTFRVVLSYVDEVETMDLILEVWKDKALVGHVWRQNSDNCSHVELEIINTLEGCEYQSFLLHCLQGFTYNCIVASNVSMTQFLRLQVQIYSSAGLIYQCSDPPSIGELYWHVCSWDSSGALDSTTA